LIGYYKIHITELRAQQTASETQWQLLISDVKRTISLRFNGHFPGKPR